MGCVVQILANGHWEEAWEKKCQVWRQEMFDSFVKPYVIKPRHLKASMNFDLYTKLNKAGSKKHPHIPNAWFSICSVREQINYLAYEGIFDDPFKYAFK